MPASIVGTAAYISADHIPVRYFGLCKLPLRPRLQYVGILTSCTYLAAVAVAAILPSNMPIVVVVLSVFSRLRISKNLVHPPCAGNGNFVCLVSSTAAAAKRAYFVRIG